MGWSLSGRGELELTDLYAACDAVLPIALSNARSEWDVRDMRECRANGRLDLLIQGCPGRWRAFQPSPVRLSVFGDENNRSYGGDSTEGMEEFRAMAQFVKRGVVNLSGGPSGTRRWEFKDGNLVVLAPVTATVWVPSEAEGIDPVFALIESAIRDGRAPALAGLSHEAMVELANLLSAK